MLATYLSILITLALGPARNADAPKLPYVDRDVCPFECCQFGEWTARSSYRVQTASNISSSVAFAIHPGEKVQALTGLVITRKAGIVIVRKETRFYDITVPAGAKLYVLHSLGEGAYVFWYNGAKHSGELYAESAHKGNEAYPWDVLSVARGEWWVKVRNQHGAVGWILNPRGFRGMDACGS